MEELIMEIRTPKKQIITTTTTTLPSWKLYENPFYHSQQHYHQKPSKIDASIWNLKFLTQIMDSKLEIAQAKIMELKAELEFEIKARRKFEFINKRLTKELSEERREREAMERVFQELTKGVASDREEIDRMKREMEEEREMLRMAEVLREERVQMKLTEAKILLQEKLSELKFSKDGIQVEEFTDNVKQNEDKVGSLMADLSRNSSSNDQNRVIHMTTRKPRVSPEVENPHIKRGIKGFVEFPRAVRVIGSRGRHLSMKLEGQKAQLRLLLRQKCPI